MGHSLDPNLREQLAHCRPWAPLTQRRKRAVNVTAKVASSGTRPVYTECCHSGRFCIVSWFFVESELHRQPSSVPPSDHCMSVQMQQMSPAEEDGSPTPFAKAHGSAEPPGTNHIR